MSYPALRRHISLALIVLVAGCGGAHGPSTGGGDLTPDQRDAAIDRVYNQYKTINHSDPRAFANAMAAYIKSQPEFSDAGVTSDLNIWGQFKDGPIYGLINNDPDMWLGKSAPQPAPVNHAGRSGTQTLPQGSKVHLLHGFFNDRPNINDELELMLGEAHGYTVNKSDVTLAALQAVQADTGLLVTNSHGGMGPDPFVKGKEHFYLITNSGVPPRHPVRGEPLFDEWKAGRIALWGTVIENRVIGVGPGWVQNNMHFGPNSLWINNACMGFNQEFRDAAFHNNLGAYIGWDQSVHFLVADTAALFIVDRLTGANIEQLYLEDPPERAFTISLILGDLHSRPGQNLITNPTLDHSIWIEMNGTIPDAHLLLEENPLSGAPPDSFGSLTPNIEQMNVDATADNEMTLQILGFFGTHQGTVTIGGHDVTVKQWKPFEIDVILPAGDQPGASGDVVVDVNGHKSNAVQLTMWTITLHSDTQETYSGTVTLDAQSHLMGDVSGNTSKSGDLKIFVRADVHDFYNGPGQKPLVQRVVTAWVTHNALKTQNAKVTSWHAQGAVTTQVYQQGQPPYDTWTDTFADAGSPPVVFDGSDQRGRPTNCYGIIDVKTHHMDFNNFFTVDGLFEVTHTTTFPPAQNVKHTGGGLRFSANNSISLTLDDNWNMPGGSYSEPINDPADGITGTFTLTWSGTVSDPPDPHAVRSAKLKSVRR